MSEKATRIIDKVSGLFLLDDFTFDEATEIGLSVEPDNTSGFITLKATFNSDGTFDKWVEGAV